MSDDDREHGSWYWSAPNVKRWVSAEPEPTEAELRAELAKLAVTLPAEWLNTLIRAAKYGPEALSSAYGTQAPPPDWTERSVDEAELKILDWAKFAIREVGAPSYALNLPHVSLPEWGFSREVSLEELAEAGGFDAVEFAAQVAEEAQLFDSVAPDMRQWDPRLQAHGLQAMHALEAGLTQILREHGILRGPCPRCNRPKWLTKYRPPKAPGRTPLDHTYCPECVEAIKREQRAESKRRARADGRAV